MASKEEKDIKRRESYAQNKDEINAKRRERYARNKERYKETRQKNKEKIDLRNADYYSRNKEKIKQRQRDYFQENKESVLSRQKEYRRDNEVFRKKRREYQKSYYLENKDYFKEKNKEYRKSFLGEDSKKYQNHLKNQRKYKNKRYGEDISYNIVQRLRARMNKSLRELHINKTQNTIELLGCSPEILKSHLESKFYEGMNWDNRDMWHIDHIIPISFFTNNMDFKDPAIQKLCFNYKNLQPLWREENILKKDNLPDEYEDFILELMKSEDR